MRNRILTTGVLSVVLLAAVGWGRAEEAAPVAGPEAIQQTAPRFYVHADVDRASHEYAEGDVLSLTITCEVDAYLYVIYQQADGKLFKIFPNSAQPGNLVKARQTVQIPMQAHAFRWKIGAPFGEELIKVIASREPLSQFTGKEVPKSLFTPVAKGIVSAVAKDLQESTPARNWSETTVKITTVKKSSQQARTGKRFGLFLGASTFEFADLMAKGREEQLDVCRTDALLMQEAFNRVGQLNESRALVADKCTRANMQAAITQWLPSVSKPGDTVIIFWAGHGMELPDNDGDDPDGVDELLCTHDLMPLEAFEALFKQQKEDKLNPALEPRVRAMFEKLDAAGLVGHEVKSIQLEGVLCRESGVSDDLLGHWLQSLTGRKIIFIMEACHSGGFAKAGKTKDLGDDDTVPPRFRFLEKHLGRLKDIGQPDCALLAACQAKQVASAYAPADRPLSVFTYSVMRAIEDTSTPLNTEQTYRQCSAMTKEIFQAINDAREKKNMPPLSPADPFYIDYSKPPALLKP